MSEDVLVKYAWKIERAEKLVERGNATDQEEPMADLAAEVRAQRKENERLLADWAADLDRLEKRVAEMEPDAELGKRLRDLPSRAVLSRITPWQVVYGYDTEPVYDVWHLSYAVQLCRDSWAELFDAVDKKAPI